VLKSQVPVNPASVVFVHHKPRQLVVGAPNGTWPFRLRGGREVALALVLLEAGLSRIVAAGTPAAGTSAGR
jgi:hypothetical protein